MANEFTPRAHIEYWFPNAIPVEALEITSANDLCYNCVAWSLGIDSRWVQPYAEGGVQVAPWAVWPNAEDRGSAIEIYTKMYRGEGFVKAIKGVREPGFEKIAIYWDKTSKQFLHVARQMEDGSWTSKLGRSSDVKHAKPDTLGPAGSPGGYGQLWGYMKRAKGLAGKQTPLQVRIQAG